MIDQRQLEDRRREARRAALLKWFVPPPPAPPLSTASLLSVKVSPVRRRWPVARV